MKKALPCVIVLCLMVCASCSKKEEPVTEVVVQEEPAVLVQQEVVQTPVTPVVEPVVKVEHWQTVANEVAPGVYECSLDDALNFLHCIPSQMGELFVQKNNSSSTSASVTVLDEGGNRVYSASDIQFDQSRARNGSFECTSASAWAADGTECSVYVVWNSETKEITHCFFMADLASYPFISLDDEEITLSGADEMGVAGPVMNLKFDSNTAIEDGFNAVLVKRTVLYHAPGIKNDFDRTDTYLEGFHFNILKRSAEPLSLDGKEQYWFLVTNGWIPAENLLLFPGTFDSLETLSAEQIPTGTYKNTWLINKSDQSLLFSDITFTEGNRAYYHLLFPKEQYNQFIDADGLAEYEELTSVLQYKPSYGDSPIVSAKTDSTSVHEKPSDSSPVITTITEKDFYYNYVTDDGWYYVYVSDPDTYGWVHLQ